MHLKKIRTYEMTAVNNGIFKMEHGAKYVNCPDAKTRKNNLSYLKSESL